MVSPKALHHTLTTTLDAAGIPDAAFDVRCMLEQVTSRPFHRLMQEDSLPADAEAAVRAMADRRMQGEPLQYLLGEWEFYGMRLFVGPGVLIPRPDTETLVDVILERFPKQQQLHILDLCSGSGCIALALAKHLPHAQVHALDYSEQALDYLHRNVALHGLDVTVHFGDVLEETTVQSFRDVDLIVSNPPYLTAEDMIQLQREVRHEPAMALAAGDDGLRFYRRMTAIWRHALKAGGMLLYEVGAGQAPAVAALLQENGFTAIEIHRDALGIERAVLGVLPSEITSA